MTIVSAPGKVLLAGGYLVLDPAYSGVVVSTSSRFYTAIKPGPGESPKVVRVKSPQFVDAGWKYSVDITDDGTVNVVQQPRGS
jgi:phosphomevalonate kinase